MIAMKKNESQMLMVNAKEEDRDDDIETETDFEGQRKQ